MTVVRLPNAQATDDAPRPTIRHTYRRYAPKKAPLPALWTAWPAQRLPRTYRPLSRLQGHPSPPRHHRRVPGYLQLLSPRVKLPLRKSQLTGIEYRGVGLAVPQAPQALEILREIDSCIVPRPHDGGITTSVQWPAECQTHYFRSGKRQCCE